MAGMGGQDLIQVALLVAVVLTPVGGLVSWLLLGRFARRIATLTGQEMRRGGSSNDGSGRRPSRGATVRPRRPPPAAERALRAARRNLALYTVGSGLFAIVAAVVYLTSMSADIAVNRQSATLIVLLALCFGLPAVVAIPMVHRPKLGGPWLWSGVWLSAVVLLLVFGQGPHHQSPIRLFAIVVTPVVVPVLIALLITRRSTRGVAWVLAPAVTTTIFAAVGLGGLGLSDRRGLVAVIVSGAVVLGVAFSTGIWWAYRARRISDQGVAMTLVWFYTSVGLLYFVHFAHSDAWLLWTVVPLLLFVVVVAVGFRVVRDKRQNRPANLLVLRSFRHDRGNVRFLRELEMYWRYLGSILLIGGVDLAAETLEPDEMVDWARGRIADRIIADPDQVPARLAGVSLERDGDGRYRVHDLVCADGAWRATCRAVMEMVDVVVVDLRGLVVTAGGGLAWEIATLAEMPPRAIVLVTAPDTDTGVLAPLERAGHRLTILPAGGRDPRARGYPGDHRGGGAVSCRRGGVTWCRAQPRSSAPASAARTASASVTGTTRHNGDLAIAAARASSLRPSAASARASAVRPVPASTINGLPRAKETSASA